MCGGTARKKRSQPRWRSGHTHTHIISVCMCVTKLSGSAYTVCDNLPPFVTRRRRRRSRRSPLSTTPFARCGLSHSKLPPAQRTSLQHWRIRSSSMLADVAGVRTRPAREHTHVRLWCRTDMCDMRSYFYTPPPPAGQQRRIRCLCVCVCEWTRGRIDFFSLLHSVPLPFATLRANI